MDGVKRTQSQPLLMTRIAFLRAKRVMHLPVLILLWAASCSHAFQFQPPFRRTFTSLRANVAAELMSWHLGEDGDANNNKGKASTNNKGPRLSRPERKALERARKNKNNRKNANHRKHNFADRKNTLAARRRQGEGRYDLHSNAVASLNQESSADDVMRAIKRAQNLHDTHDIRAIERFLLEQTDESFAYGYRGSLLARLAVAALRMEDHELARKAMQVRKSEHQSSMLPMESAAIIRGLLRVHNVTDALQVLDDELSLPPPGSSATLTDPVNKDLIKHRALSLASVASRHFFEMEPSMAVLACQKLAALGTVVQESGLSAHELNLPWSRLLRGASQCESASRRGDDGVVATNNNGSTDGVAEVDMPCNVVYSVLTAMSTFPSDNNDHIYELLSNALVRRVVFVTGAVDMDGCPPADRGEVAFIGRSNVGKSSLINMITNRKSLAYTSKRPGKTQQFNFFAVNDKSGREKEIKYGDVVQGERDPDSFYIVDLPGFGYAKVPEQQRKKWLDFMDEYISNRPTLRVLFHLVDGRHGPTEEDASIMKKVGQDLPKHVKYVVVLTKADKNVKGAAKKNSSIGKVSPDIMKSLRSTMKANGLGNAPVILSSAETKLGRDDIWRYVRLAAET